ILPRPPLRLQRAVAAAVPGGYDHGNRRYAAPPRRVEQGADCLRVPSTSGAGWLDVPYAWLRDNCPCGKCIHPSTRQKLHSCADVRPGIRPKSVEVQGTGADERYRMTWSGSGLDRGDLLAAVTAEFEGEGRLDHISIFTAAYLAEHFDPSPSVRRFQLHPHRVLWDRKQLLLLKDSPGDKKNWVHLDEYMSSDDRGLLKILRSLGKYGLAFVTGAKNDVATTEAIAKRIGTIRDTFYGRTWDVKSVLNAKNIAYTPLHLGLHMDLLWVTSSHAQFLHCYKHSVSGGASTFLDSLAVADLLQKHSPDDYRTLRRVPVTFHYVNDGHHMRYRRPTILTSSDERDPFSGRTQADDEGPILVNSAPPFQGPLEGLSAEDARAFYSAFRRFTAIMEGSDPCVSREWEGERNNPLLYAVTLRPGDVAIFANRRVLHGRTVFDPNTGERHLKGTYSGLQAVAAVSPWLVLLTVLASVATLYTQRNVRRTFPFVADPRSRRQAALLRPAPRMTYALGPVGHNLVFNARLDQANAEDAYRSLTVPVFGREVVYDVENPVFMEQKRCCTAGRKTT
ncbi:MAG: taurine catabolism dioxygenase TauD, TfdA family-domain-containing protein, partial [Olpidium bornovanus]